MMEEEGAEMTGVEEVVPKMELHNQPDDTHEEDEVISATMMLNGDSLAADQLPGYVEYL